MLIDKNGNPQTRIKTQEFLKIALKVVHEKYIEEGFDGIKEEDIKLESYRKTLMNHKAVYVAPNTKVLMELTYNGNTNQIYLGMYKKVDKMTIDL